MANGIWNGFSADGNNLVIKFNEPISVGSGTLLIKKVDPSTGKRLLIDSFDEASVGISTFGPDLFVKINVDKYVVGNSYVVEYQNGLIVGSVSGNLSADSVSFQYQNNSNPTIEMVLDPVSFPLLEGSAATINFILSQPSSDFDQSDVGVLGGDLINWMRQDARHYSATFVPNPNSTEYGIINVSNDAFSSNLQAVGLKNKDGFDANNTVRININTTHYDNVAPKIITTPTIGFSPSNDSVNVVAERPIITLTFDEPIKLGDGIIKIQAKLATGVVIKSFDAAVSEGMRISSYNSLVLDPDIDLAAGTKYFVTIPRGSITDLTGNPYAGTMAYSFTTAGVPDNTAPTVTAFNPIDGATTVVATNPNISLIFSETVQKGSGKIEIHADSATGALFESFEVASSSALNFLGDTLIITPSNILTNSTKYFVTFAKGSVQDMAGNPYLGTITYDFTTAESASAPTLIDKIPMLDATGVPIATNITLNFNKILKKGIGSIQLQAYGSGAIFESFDVVTSTRLKFVNKQLIIDPTNTLAQGVTYTLVIPDGAIQDLAGNNYALDFEYKFTTLDTIAPTITSFSPSDGATMIATDDNISMMFSESVKFGMGLIQLRTQSATGPVVEAFNTAEGGNATIESNVLTLNPKIDLKPNILYFLTLASGAIKDMSGNPYAGIATYDFTTAQDTVPPKVLSFKPADGAIGVALDAGIELNFSEPIVPGIGNIEIRSGSRLGPVIESFNVTNSPYLQFADNMLTILPTMELVPQTNYFVTLPRGSVKDVLGNSYLGTSTYDFFTADVKPPTIVAFNPAAGATGVSIHQSIQAIFSEAIKLGTGSVEIRLGNSPVGTLVDTITITDSDIVDNILKVELNHSLALNNDYYIRIPVGSIQDMAGNNFQGLGHSFHTTNNPENLFVNTPGSDIFNGTPAIEMAAYSGLSSNFKLLRVGQTNNWYISGQGDDLLKDVERIQFSDKKIALDVGSEQNAGKAILFWSIFNPELINSPAWLGQIISLFDAGHDMSLVFNWAINTVESIIGPVSDDMLLQWVGNNVSTSSFVVNPVGPIENIDVELIAELMNNHRDEGHQGKIDFLNDVAALNMINFDIQNVIFTGIEYL